jgi:hypothetical protein
MYIRWIASVASIHWLYSKNIIFTDESQCQLNIALNFVCVFLSLCNAYLVVFNANFNNISVDSFVDGENH